MNCTVCGNPLLFDRVVFHCSCGAFVHAYCWDEHVLQAHQPSFEIGSVNLDGEFIAREESKVEEQVVVAEASENSEEQSPEEPSMEQKSEEEQSPEEQRPAEQSPEEQSSEEQTTPLLE
jgi:hypothetical protein